MQVKERHKTYLESLKQLGFNQHDLHATKIPDLAIGNIKDVIAFFDSLRNRPKAKAVTLWDVDVDGEFSGLIAYKLMKQFIKVDKLANYVNETKVHGITQDFLDYCKDTKITDVIIVDAGTNDVEEITILNEAGINVLVIDHHLKTKEYAHDRFILVNSHDLPFGQNVSGAYLTNEVMKQCYRNYFHTDFNEYDELAIASIVADICERDDFNRNLILNFMSGTCKETAILNRFRNAHTRNNPAFIVSVTSTLNAIIRLHGARHLMALLTDDNLTNFKTAIENKKLYKQLNETITLEIIKNSKVFKMSEVVMVIVPETLDSIKEDKLGHPIYIRNYLGIIASKLSSSLGKLVLVLGSKKINYEHSTNEYQYCFSARDPQKRNSVRLAQEVGIDAEGHEEAWGGYLQSDFPTHINDLNERLKEHSEKVEFPVLEVEDIGHFLADIKDYLLPFSIWNSIMGNDRKVRIQFPLVGDINTKNNIKHITYRDYTFNSFEKRLSLDDPVHLYIEYSSQISYLIKNIK